MSQTATSGLGWPTAATRRRDHPASSQEQSGQPRREPPLPPKLRQLRAELRRSDFADDRTRGSHETWEYRYDASIRVTLAGSAGADAEPYQEKQGREAIARARSGEETP